MSYIHFVFASRLQLSSSRKRNKCGWTNTSESHLFLFWLCLSVLQQKPKIHNGVHLNTG